ncbi:hypothetical protein KSP39_PZI001690 [Platanthera zijinensis]|uniref:Uncharacterized protein n=1 Tax=Platanthera zijinensis TaxID=2320716 RepID=A0AAP0GES5_9ASPA
MDPTKLSGIAAILGESLSLPAKNKRLMLPAMVLCFVPNSVLLMGNYISLYPLLLNLLVKIYLITKEDPSTPQFFDAIVGLKNDAEAFVHARIIFLVVSCAISAFSMMVMVNSSLLACSGQQSTLRDVMLRMKSNWLPVFVTYIYFALLYTGYTVLSVCFIAVPMLTANGSAVSVGAGGVAGLLARLLFAYLAAVWTVGLVVAVAEEGCFGLEALWRGGEMVRGRKIQAFLISLMLLFGDGVLAAGYGFAGTGNAAGVILVNALVMMKMFTHTVYTVFYLQCRKSASHMSQSAPL